MVVWRGGSLIEWPNRCNSKEESSSKAVLLAGNSTSAITMILESTWHEKSAWAPMGAEYGHVERVAE